MFKYHFNGQHSETWKTCKRISVFLWQLVTWPVKDLRLGLGISFLWIETWPYRLETWSCPKRLDFEITCYYKISGWNWTCLRWLGLVLNDFRLDLRLAITRLKTWHWLVFKDLRVDLKLSRMTRPDLRLAITRCDTCTCLERLETCYWIGDNNLRLKICI